MRKKISLLFCGLAVTLCFTGCGSSKETMAYDEATVQQSTEFLIEYCASMQDDTVEQWETMTDFALESQLTQAGLPFTKDGFLGALDAWQSAEKECGEYVSHGDYTYEASKDELQVSTEAEFADRDAHITFVFDENQYLDSMTVDAEYTTGEILKKAGLNTVLGMGTVFVVLIFISALISLFRFIPAIEAAFKKKKDAPKAAPAVQPEVAPSVEEAEDVTDDTELVAVIAAAIAASEGSSSTDGFTVRSIRRRPSNKW